MAPSIPTADQVVLACRSEAQGVPSLLVAHKARDVDKEDDYITAKDGYYADGAYTAHPRQISSMQGPDMKVDEEGETDPQDAYYAVLIERFRNASSQLHNPATAPTLDTATIESLQVLASASYKIWRTTFVVQNPRPKLLYGLPQEAVLQGLEVLGSLLISTKNEDRKRWRRLGAWAWALLVKCRDMNEMSSEEVSMCRDLGKAAIRVLWARQAGVHHPSETDNGLETEDDEIGYEEQTKQQEPTHTNLEDGAQALTVEAEHAQSIRRPGEMPQITEGDLVDLPRSEVNGENSPTDMSPQDHVPRTLDMIITIVGEVYGQRDLLEARFVWGEEVAR